MRELEVNNQLKNAVENTDKAKSESKLSYEARKEQSRKIRKAEKDVSEIESVIAKSESELLDMSKQLEIFEFATDPDFIQLFQKKQRDQEHKLYEWEILCEQLENLKMELE